jgi:uncharacterized protein DUF4435
MKRFLNADTFANDARMRRTVLKGSAFLFVEGASDDRFYGIFINPAKCQIIICHGRDRVIGACEILNSDGFPGFLGIVDADFRRAEGDPIGVANVLLTDFHDAECFMLRSGAFDRLLVEFASGEKLKAWQEGFGADLREHFLTHSGKVGLLLWHSTISGLELHFDNLEVKEYANRDSLHVDVSRLVEHTKHKSQRHDLQNAGLLQGISDRAADADDLWQIVRGRDFIELIGYALRHALGSRAANEVSVERLEQSLRLAYSQEDFAVSKLYVAIRQWEEANHPYIILKVSVTGTLLTV